MVWELDQQRPHLSNDSRPFNPRSYHLKVKDAIIDSGWDWDRIPFVLPADIRDLIQAIPMSITSKGSDRLAWMGSAKGGFDVKVLVL